VHKHVQIKKSLPNYFLRNRGSSMQQQVPLDKGRFDRDAIGEPNGNSYLSLSFFLRKEKDEIQWKVNNHTSLFSGRVKSLPSKIFIVD